MPIPRPCANHALLTEIAGFSAETNKASSGSDFRSLSRPTGVFAALAKATMHRSARGPCSTVAAPRNGPKGTAGKARLSPLRSITVAPASSIGRARLTTGSESGRPQPEEPNTFGRLDFTIKAHDPNPFGLLPPQTLKKRIDVRKYLGCFYRSSQNAQRTEVEGG